MDMYYMMSIIILGALAYGLISFLAFLLFFEDNKLEKERVAAYSILWAPLSGGMDYNKYCKRHESSYY